MKKILTFGIATTALTLSAFAQTSLFDSFDYGTGVSGRTGISTGDSLNGATVLDSSETWVATGTGTNVVSFDGSAGIGNGQLDMTSDGNSTAYTAFDFSSGVVNATINFTMTTQGSSGAAGIYLGFQATTPDNGLLTNQTSDTIWVKISESSIGFRSRTNGDTINSVSAAGESTWNWTSGNSGSMNLAYDLSGNSVTATVMQEGTTIFTSTLDITTTSGYTPSFGSIALNTITMDTVTVQDINVAIPEPQTYAMSLGALALALAATRRRQHRNK
ncbi:PEP-CTERM sorting domain-containing protein [Coraliomargarita sp. W4R72]